MDSSRPPGWYPCESYPHLVNLVQWWDGSRWELRLGNVVDDGERDARKAELGRLQSEIETAKVVLRNLEQAVEATPTDNLPAALGFRDYKTIADNSESIMNEIKAIRAEAKKVLRSKSALSEFPASMTSADGYEFEMSKKYAATIGPLLLNILNLQVEVEATRKTGSFRDGQRRLDRTWDKLNEVAKQFGTYLDYSYFRLRDKELELLEDHRDAVLREKEEERERRAELREEAQAQRELEAERAKLQKELDHYYNVIVALEAQGDKAGIERVEAQILALEEELKDIDFRAANIRAGYVYVISNVGAFGPDVVKIGLTRRLDPLDRIRELSSGGPVQV